MQKCNMMLKWAHLQIKWRLMWRDPCDFDFDPSDLWPMYDYLSSNLFSSLNFGPVTDIILWCINYELTMHIRRSRIKMQFSYFKMQIRELHLYSRTPYMLNDNYPRLANNLWNVYKNPLSEKIVWRLKSWILKYNLYNLVWCWWVLLCLEKHSGMRMYHWGWYSEIETLWLEHHHI